MRKIGISVGALTDIYGWERMLELVKSIGADCIDFNLTKEDYRKSASVYSLPEAEMIAHFERIKARADAIGIEISQTHGRISTFKNIPENDAAALKNARLDCLATKVLCAPYCVMHGVTTCNFEADTPSEFMHDLNYAFFSQALAYAREFDVKIATETFGDAPNKGCCDFFGNAVEFKRFYDRVQRECEYADCLVMCADTGHSNKAMRYNGNPTPGDVIRMLGSSVKCLHLNDNDTITDQHKPPMTGSIDWEDVLSALDEIGYDGVYSMELVLKRFGEGLELDTAAFAIKIMRNLLRRHYGEK